MKPADPSTEFGSLNLSDGIPSSQSTVAYEEDMDWTPTQSSQSPHRAFQTYDPTRALRSGFNEAPVDTNRGEFWYKVPPAPTSMARRIRNPPAPARITQPHVPRETFSFKPTRQPLLAGRKEQTPESQPDVEFAQPSFLPKAPPNDPRNSLSDLFGRSFTLSPSQESSGRRGSSGRPHSANPSDGLPSSSSDANLRRPGRPAELILLVACLVGWLHAAGARHDYAAHVKLGIVCVCLAVSARVTGDSVREYKAAKGLRWTATAVVGALLGAAELALACHFVFEILAAGNGPGAQSPGFASQGTGLIGTMLVHQLWNLLV